MTRSTSHCLYRSVFLLVTVSTWLLVTTPAARAADLSALPDDTCYRFPLVERGSGLIAGIMPASMGWTTAGVQIEDPEDGLTKTLAVDTIFERLPLVPVGDPIERSISKVFLAGSETEVSISQPLTMDTWKGGSLALLDIRGPEQDHVYFFDRDLRIEKAIPTSGLVPTSALQLQDMNGGIGELWGVFQMITTGTEWRFLGLSDWGRNPDDPNKGIYHLAYFDDSNRHRIAWANIPAHLMEYYTRGVSFMASLGGSEFVLIMDQEPQVARFSFDEPRLSRLPAFPDGLRCPRLERPYDRPVSNLQTLRWLNDIYRTIEDAPMPIGIYAIADRLFVLTKGAINRKHRATDWWLIEISSEDGSETGNRIQLPTEAASITLIKGERFVGLIEQGTAELIGDGPRPRLFRPSQSMVLMPVRWLGSATEARFPAESCSPLE